MPLTSYVNFCLIFS